MVEKFHCSLELMLYNQGFTQWGRGGGSFPPKTPSFLPKRKKKKREKKGGKEREREREEGERVFFAATMYAQPLRLAR